MGPIASQSREILVPLAPVPESAREARRALRAHGLHEDIEHTVTLLATEIVANAIRHAGMDGDERILLFARLGEDFARVEIADAGPGFDPDALDAEGFGLRLMRKLASRWGVDRTDRGFRVWFVVDRRPRRLPAAG